MSGGRCVLLDCDKVQGGGSNADILEDEVHERVVGRVRAKEFDFIFAAPPCRSFTIVRHLQLKEERDGGPPILMKREQPEGIDGLDTGHQLALERDNKIVTRTLAILATQDENGGEHALEHPPDRGDPEMSHLFKDSDHAPIWVFPPMVKFVANSGINSVTFFSCARQARQARQASPASEASDRADGDTRTAQNTNQQAPHCVSWSSAHNTC